MQIQHAIHLVREACAIRHLSLKTEKSYTHWLRHYGLFLRDPGLKSQTTERKMEAFLTRLAHHGVSAGDRRREGRWSAQDTAESPLSVERRSAAAVRLHRFIILCRPVVLQFRSLVEYSGFP